MPRVWVQCEMQSVSSRIWTRVAVSISYDDNDYITGTYIWDGLDDGIYMSPKSIIPKVNALERVEFELAYFEVALQHFSSYTPGVIVHMCLFGNVPACNISMCICSRRIWVYRSLIVCVRRGILLFIVSFLNLASSTNVFAMGICAKWNANNFVQDLNSNHRLYCLWGQPLH